MYRIFDKKSAIYEIQKYLYRISDKCKDMPRVFPDGVWGDRSREATRYFQKNSNLDQSGSVDNLTFEKLYEEYLNTVFWGNAEKYPSSASDFPYKFGDRGSTVLKINHMVNELRRYYVDITQVKTNDFFTRDTESAVRDIRAVFSLPGAMEVDIPLYDRMIKELEIRYEFD